MSPDELDNLPPPPPPTLNDLPSLGDFDRPPNYGEVFTNDLPPSYTVEESTAMNRIQYGIGSSVKKGNGSSSIKSK